LERVSLSFQLLATDVAFWSEYAPDQDDQAMTYLLLQLEQWPPRASGGPIEPIGQPGLADNGRFSKALRLDGCSALRCVTTNVFEGGHVSIEAWLRLERYPEKEACIVFRPAVVDQQPAYDPKVELKEPRFAPGVRGLACAGGVSVTAPNLFRSAEESLEFWLRPVGVNNLSMNRPAVGADFLVCRQAGKPALPPRSWPMSRSEHRG
jgi:hypothetical protein